MQKTWVKLKLWKKTEPGALTVGGADKGEAGDDPEEGHGGHGDEGSSCCFIPAACWTVANQKCLTVSSSGYQSSGDGGILTTLTPWHAALWLAEKRKKPKCWWQFYSGTSICARVVLSKQKFVKLSRWKIQENNEKRGWKQISFPAV